VTNAGLCNFNASFNGEFPGNFDMCDYSEDIFWSHRALSSGLNDNYSPAFYSILDNAVVDPTAVHLGASSCNGLWVVSILILEHYSVAFTYPVADQTPFDARNNMVLITKHGPESYPAGQTQDKVVKIRATVTGSGNRATKPFSLRVIRCAARMEKNG
jgi:hypothetical protein